MFLLSRIEKCGVVYFCKNSLIGYRMVAQSDVENMRRIESAAEQDTVELSMEDQNTLRDSMVMVMERLTPLWKTLW